MNEIFKSSNSCFIFFSNIYACLLDEIERSRCGKMMKLVKDVQHFKKYLKSFKIAVQMHAI